MVVEIAASTSSSSHSPLRITFNGLGIHVNAWHELDRFERRWTESQNPRTGAPYALVEGDGLESPESGVFKIISRDGPNFRVVSSGVLADSVSFSIDATFTFQGVTVHSDKSETEDAFRRRLEIELPGHDLLLERIANNEDAPGKTFAHFVPKMEASK